MVVSGNEKMGMAFYAMTLAKMQNSAYI